ncbi:MAG: elongation factor G [Candidatus Shapirobacteria bacterium]
MSVTNEDTAKKRSVALDKIRNIGIIAHIDAGKTTTTERVLFYTGRSYKIGDIDEGTTQMDWMAQERERGITIVSAATTTFWTPTWDEDQGAVPKDAYRFNIIDTPGHVDFTAEVERSLRVLDGGIMVFDAEEGVQSQSETVWRQADKYHVPRICFVNKMDKLGADFERTVAMIKERLGANAAVMVVPMGSEDAFKGIVLVLEEKALIWSPEDETGEKYQIVPVPEEYQEKVASARAILVEKIAENDEAVMDKYLAEEILSVVELKQGLRRATIAGKLVPIFCGSSLRNKGVQPVLDAVVDFLPSPLDIPPVTYTVEAAAPLSALAFKIQTDPHVGKLTYVRAYSGTLRAGEEVWNSSKHQSERIGRLLLMHANQREPINSAICGEIVAAIGLKETATGDTLCQKDKEIILESISFPEPVISLAIEPKTKADQEKLGYALKKLSEEDPTFKISSDHETGQTIISGMGELHLEIIVDRMKREFGVVAGTGEPQVAYRETVRSTARDEGKYIRQSGGRGQYGHCLLRVEPKERGSGFEFKNEIKGGVIPSEFIPAVEKGVKEAVEKGVLAGFSVTDILVAVYDGSFHEVDSSEVAFKIAASMAFQGAVKKAEPILLEPIMKLEVTLPEEFMGDVIGDLSSRRAQILGTESRGHLTVVKGMVPLAEVPGYSTTLRSMTQGRGSFYMEPSHYQDVPGNITEKIVARRTGKTGA